MKAIVQCEYGGPESLAVREVPTPEPTGTEVLVEVTAAGLNARDWHLLRGDPYLARLAPPLRGLRTPRPRILGSDIAGRVVAVGAGATRFAIGDEVYADLRETDGGLAEFVCRPEAQLHSAPRNLNLAHAAAVPLAASTALAGLRDAGGVLAGHRVLINGASGGVGTYAVQLARWLGAHVTAVCSTRNTDLAAALGASDVIDYTRRDFVSAGTWDVLFDLVGNRSLADLRRAVEPGGTVVLSGGGVSGNGRVQLAGPMRLMLRAATVGRLGRPRVRVLATVPPGAALPELTALIEAGTLAPAVDRMYPFADAPAALRYLETEHARAKVVITRD